MFDLNSMVGIFLMMKKMATCNGKVVRNCCIEFP